MKKKILFVVTEDWYFISHRLKLAEYLVKKGFKVSLCCKDTGKFEFIEERGIYCYNIDTKRNSLSLVHFINELIDLIKTIKIVQPEITHLISMRPIMLGIIISLFVKSKFVATFTGMGFLFTKKGLKGIILRKMIIYSIKICIFFKKTLIVVQNKDDEYLFKRIFKVKENLVQIIRGSGIDLKIYKYYPENIKKEVKIAYAGRILKDKGVLWLLEAFKEAKKTCSNIKLYIAGPLDESNPTSIKKNQFEKLIKIDGINYLGNIKDINKFWRESNIAILLSKREGLPLSLLEAASVGRAIISTDVPGSKEIAINGYNSINIEPGNILECTNAIIKLTNNKRLRKKYGQNSRKLVESDLALEHICYQYYRLYSKLKI